MIQKKETSIRDTLNYSVMVIVSRKTEDSDSLENMEETEGSGFLLEKEDGEKKKYLLVTSCLLTNAADSIYFIIHNSFGNKSFKIKDKQPYKLSNTLDVVMFDISDIVNKEGSNISKANILNEKCFISYKENGKILEKLFTVSQLKDYTPMIIECKNITAISDERNRSTKGFIILELKQYDWILGAPVFGFFNKKIKLVGIIVGLGNLPNELCLATGTCGIEWMLKWYSTPIPNRMASKKEKRQAKETLMN